MSAQAFSSCQSVRQRPGDASHHSARKWPHVPWGYRKRRSGFRSRSVPGGSPGAPGTGLASVAPYAPHTIPYPADRGRPAAVVLGLGAGDAALLQPVMQVAHRRAIALGDKRLGRPIAQEGLDLGLLRIELTLA